MPRASWKQLFARPWKRRAGIFIRNPENGETYLRAALSGECSDHDPHRPLDDGIEGVLWLSHPQIVARSRSLRSPLVLRCLDDYLSGARYPLALLQNLP